MFGRKKEPYKGKGKALANQLGLFGASPEDGEDDEALDAELAALIAGEENQNRRSNVSPAKTSPSKSAARNDAETKKILEMDKLITEGLKDIPSDEDVSDTEDPDLLAELADIAVDYNTPPDSQASRQAPPPPAKPSDSSGKTAQGASMVDVVEDRLLMYERAHSAAKEADDSSKARRIDRGIKTLRDLLKKAQLGKPVQEDDLPPPVAVSTTAKPPADPQPPSQSPAIDPTTSPSRPATTDQPKVSPIKPAVTPKPPVAVKPLAPAVATYKAPPNLSAEEVETHRALTIRQDQFKQAVLQAKHKGDTHLAAKYLGYYKTFEKVINAFENQQPIDLSQMPPPPPGFTAPEVKVPTPHVERERNQGSSAPTQRSDLEDIPPSEEPNEEEVKKLFKAPASASSVLEALEQRLAKYQSAADDANQEGNGGKQRRMGRIAKQYEDAIKAHKAGKPVDFSELPNPPGFPPIPVASSSQPANSAASVPSASRTEPVSPGAANQSKPAQHLDQPTPPKMKRQPSVLSKNEQNTLFLQERQLQFKKAALKAKNEGEIELAKKYLQLAHGFNGMIQASQAGLPVDMSNIPCPPGVKDIGKLEFVPKAGAQGESEGGNSGAQGDRDTVYKRLEQDLIAQIRTCTSNSDHFTKLGDVSTASKFDKYRAGAQRDLDALKNAYTHGDPVPRFHYENRTFTMVKSCPELGDNDLELNIIRGINYGLPKDYRPNDLDTYVKYEMPFPKDTPQKNSTGTCKGTENPEYNSQHRLQIDRKSRVFARIVSSKSIKLEVFYRRGFLKGDKLFGSAAVKLQSLENQCEVHDSYDLMDGRKAVGGKLEVKLRIRNPLVNKQVEEVKEKWLVIDVFERNLNSQAVKPKGIRQDNTKGSTSDRQHFTSIEVLKYEKQLLDQQIQRYQGKLNPSELGSIQQKGRQIEKQIEDTKALISKGGLTQYQAYADSIVTSVEQYQNDAKTALQQNNREKAQVLLTKKKLVEREVESIRSKLAKT